MGVAVRLDPPTFRAGAGRRAVGAGRRVPGGGGRMAALPGMAACARHHTAAA